MKHFFNRSKRAGFSLIELIVTIAIMAVLVTVLTPALLTYVERTRAQKDESEMDEVTNAIELALADEEIYEEILAQASETTTTLRFVNNGNGTYTLSDATINGGSNTLDGLTGQKLSKRLNDLIGNEVKLTSRTHRIQDYIVEVDFGGQSNEMKVAVTGSFVDSGNGGLTGQGQASLASCPLCGESQAPYASCGICGESYTPGAPHECGYEYSSISGWDEENMFCYSCQYNTGSFAGPSVCGICGETTLFSNGYGRACANPDCTAEPCTECFAPAGITSSGPSECPVCHQNTYYSTATTGHEDWCSQYNHQSGRCDNPSCNGYWNSSSNSFVAKSICPVCGEASVILIDGWELACTNPACDAEYCYECGELVSPTDVGPSECPVCHQNTYYVLGHNHIGEYVRCENPSCDGLWDGSSFISHDEALAQMVVGATPVNMVLDDETETTATIYLSWDGPIPAAASTNLSLSSETPYVEVNTVSVWVDEDWMYHEIRYFTGVNAIYWSPITLQNGSWYEAFEAGQLWTAHNRVPTTSDIPVP